MNNNHISEKIKVFETLEPIEISAEWNQELMNKLVDSKNKNTVLKTSKLAIATICLIFINVAFTIIVLSGKNNEQAQRTEHLQIISNELLINAI